MADWQPLYCSENILCSSTRKIHKVVHVEFCLKYIIMPHTVTFQIGLENIFYLSSLDPHLKEIHENSLNFANSLKDLEISWNFIKYINMLENSLNLTKINYFFIFSLIVIKAPTQNILFPW